MDPPYYIIHLGYWLHCLLYIKAAVQSGLLDNSISIACCLAKKGPVGRETTATL